MEVIGSIYTEVSDNFQKGIIRGGIARCVKAEKHDLGVVLMNDVKVVGSLEGKFESTNRIYDVVGCSPTLSTMQGGNQEPKILEVKQLGFMDNGTGKHQSNTVYDENAVCPNITTIEGGGTQQIKILTAEALRMVRTEEGKALRKQYENHEIHHGFNEYREPELRTDGVANTLSTVQKDNHICVAMRGRNPENPSDRTAGNPTEQRLEMNTQGTSNCLTSVQKDNLVMETVKIKQATKNGYAECEVGGVFDASYPESDTRRGRVQDGGNTCPTITAQNQELCHIQPNYRIRKLTPRECGRLMGVSDEDISKMAAVNSNTQLYKQFGNSIVVDVMVAMFKNLGIEQRGARE